MTPRAPTACQAWRGSWGLQAEELGLERPVHAFPGLLPMARVSSDSVDRYWPSGEEILTRTTPERQDRPTQQDFYPHLLQYMAASCRKTLKAEAGTRPKTPMQRHCTYPQCRNNSSVWGQAGVQRGKMSPD